MYSRGEQVNTEAQLTDTNVREGIVDASFSIGTDENETFLRIFLYTELPLG